MLLISHLQKQDTCFCIKIICPENLDSQLKNVFKKFYIFWLDLPDPAPQLTDKPKYARFKDAENHSISSIDSIFVWKKYACRCYPDKSKLELEFVCLLWHLEHCSLLPPDWMAYIANGTRDCRPMTSRRWVTSFEIESRQTVTRNVMVSSCLQGFRKHSNQELNSSETSCDKIER
jgi:hypothetical protein